MIMIRRNFLLVQLFSDNLNYSADLELTLARATDWTIVSGNIWIIWTKLPAKTWYNRLKPHLGLHQNILILRIDPRDRAGRMPSPVWEFIKSKDNTESI